MTTSRLATLRTIGRERQKETAMKKTSYFVRGALVGTLALGMAPVAAFADDAGSGAASSNVIDTLIAENQQRWNAFAASGDLGDLTDRDAYNFEGGVSTLSADLLSYMPAHYDLRDEGVVTPVKFQNPWGTCWGFAAVAASETSILSEMGLTYEETGLDLSELQLAWFSQTALPEDGFSQGGEGSYAVDADDRLNTGGFPFTATSIFSSGVGPIFEKQAPYRNAEGLTVDMPDGTPVYYSPEGDWSVDEDLRFAQVAELEESSMLPSPAYSDDVTAYQYNEDGTIAIKQELMAGRAVQVAFCADTSRPGQTDPEAYINTETWAHYTYDPNASANHAVTIVGWDDDYSADNFLEGHKPPANGAWIVKNSWGSDEVGFPNYSPSGWGVDGDGYFYLSYYDMSLCEAETVNFDVESMQSEREHYYVDAYDYMPSNGVNATSSSDPVSMANVFTAEDDQVLRTVSVETATPGTTATFDIYVLDDDASSPLDGRLAASAAETYEYGGYHQTDLEAPVSLERGDRYSVVVTLRTASGAYQVLSESSLNEAGVEYIKDAYGMETNTYVKGIINEGESYIIDADGAADWKEATDSIKAASPEGAYIDYDNFAIKAYSDPMDPDNPSSGYDDVFQGEWYSGAVDFVTREGIMTGYGNGLFGPNDAMQRQDIACMFFKWFAPEEAAKYNDPALVAAETNKTGLPDVADGAYYTAAVNWCYENGVMTGHQGEEARFGVGENITREQFAKVLYEATGQQGEGVIAGDFPDKNAVSHWAMVPLAWATGEGIITGIDGYLMPQDTATRAQIATMAMRASLKG